MDINQMYTQVSSEDNFDTSSQSSTGSITKPKKKIGRPKKNVTPMTPEERKTSALESKALWRDKNREKTNEYNKEYYNRDIEKSRLMNSISSSKFYANHKEDIAFTKSLNYYRKTYSYEPITC
jgi:tRNA pseudouridine-54 N-methylase